MATAKEKQKLAEQGIEVEEVKGTPVSKEEAIATMPKVTPIVQKDQSFQIENLISQAISNNTPVETMERLLAMRKQLKDEWAKEQYDRAMAKLQSELPVIEKRSDAGSGNFTYKYSPLEYIIEKTKKPISDNGFSYYFDTEEDGSFMTIYCHTTHEAGFTKISKFKLPIDKGARMNATQQYGSALTYGKRYCFCNAFGIVVGGEDNDAQDNAKAETKTTTQRPTTPAKPTNDTRVVSVAQIKYIRNLLNTKGYTEEQLLKKYKKAKMELLTRDDATKIITNLNKLADNPSEQPDPAEPEIDIDEVDAGIEAQRKEREGK